MISGLIGVEAKLRYEANRFIVVENGWFVKCAVTGEDIYIEDLRYWSIELQEAYKDASAMWKREMERRSEKS
jgi:hypothetical protein